MVDFAQGEKPNEAEKVTTVTESKPEGTVPTVDIASLQSELEKSKQEITKWQEEAKKHQQNVSKKAAELDKAKLDMTEVKTLRKQVELLAQAILKDDDGDGENPQPSKKKSETLAAIQSAGAQAQYETERMRQTEYNSRANEIYSKAKVAYADNPDELERIEGLLVLGYSQPEKFEKALIKVSDTEKKPKQPVETDADKEKRLRKEIEAKIWEEKGWNVSDTGKPSGNGTRIFTRQQINSMSPEEYRKNKPAIDEAESAGHIK